MKRFDPTSVDEEGEKNELEDLRKLLENVSFNDFEIGEEIGKGSFGVAFECRIPQAKNINLVLKVFYDPEKEKIETEKDGLYMEYHKNVVMILRYNGVEKVDESKLKFKKVKLKRKRIKKEKKLIAGWVVMKHYSETLKKWIDERGRTLTLLEVCHVLNELIQGIRHLSENKIVHRDLHVSNVFIDVERGRLWIGDFGCSLDLNKNLRGFVVPVKHVEEMKLFSNTLNVGGAEEFLPPEVKKEKDEFIENMNQIVDENRTINYEKCDLYSVGINGKILMDYVMDDVDLERKGVLNEFIAEFLHEEISDRIDFESAEDRIEDILTFLKDESREFLMTDIICKYCKNELEMVKRNNGWWIEHTCKGGTNDGETIEKIISEMKGEHVVADSSGGGGQRRRRRRRKKKSKNHEVDIMYVLKHKICNDCSSRVKRRLESCEVGKNYFYFYN